MKKIVMLLAVLLLVITGCQSNEPKPDPEKKNITEKIFVYHYGDGILPSKDYDMELVLKYNHNDERGYQVVYRLFYSVSASEDGAFEMGTMEYVLDEGIDPKYFADAVSVQTPYDKISVKDNVVIIEDKQWEFYGGLSMRMAITDIKDEMKKYQSCDLYFNDAAKEIWYPKN